jgi:molybdopterin synthase catalytic subunit
MLVMRVRVLFFGMLREIVGRAEDTAEVPDGARVDDLFARYGKEHPRLAALQASVVASVNEEFSPWNAPLAAGDEVAFLPPVSGGEKVAAAEDVIELVRAPIRTREFVESAKAPSDGAVAAFEGIVRNNSKGRATLYLEYEAYEPMALRQMRAISAEMRAKFAIDRIVMVHRLGRLEIGETSVLIVVSSPHRAAAFDACRYGIDTLKRTVPIWEKEYFADGSMWADGEVPAVKPSEAESESIS